MKTHAWGKRHVAGERNKLERAYEEQVLKPRLAAGEILSYRFEAVKLRLTDRDQLTTITPDYLVQMADLELQLHEVKGGHFPEHNRIKLKLLADQYPLRVILCQFKNKATGWQYKEY